jgi:hypothetical protein
MIDTGWQYAPVAFFIVTLTRKLTVASGGRPVRVVAGTGVPGTATQVFCPSSEYSQ